MTQFYLNRTRENDPLALPDGEVFHRSLEENTKDLWTDGYGDTLLDGWYWWPCFPGCLPDADPIGPFPSAKAAIRDAQRMHTDEEAGDNLEEFLE